MNKNELKDYLIIAINCMVQDEMSYGYDEKKSLEIVLEDIGLPMRDYQKLITT